MIADKTGADLFEIKLANDTYPASYTALRRTHTHKANKKTALLKAAF